MIETVPQSFARTEFLNRPKLLRYDYDPKKVHNRPSSKINKHGDEDGEPDEEDLDQDEELKRTRNPDSGNTSFIKFGEAVPLSHSLGPFPPRWKNYSPNYRGYKLNRRINQLFDIFPGNSIVVILSNVYHLLTLSLFHSHAEIAGRRIASNWS